MRILIDTHALIWFLEGNENLGEAAKSAMLDEKNERFVSAAVAWEMAIKLSIGKLHLNAPFEYIFPKQLNVNGLRLLPIELADQ